MPTTRNPNQIIHKGFLCPTCDCSQTLPADMQLCDCPCHPRDRGEVVRFTRDEVDAMQYARRMVVKAYPGENNPITRAFIDAQLRLINAALTKMEDAYDETR